MLPHQAIRRRDELAFQAALPPTYVAALAAEGARSLQLAADALRIAAGAGDVHRGLPHSLHELTALLRQHYTIDDSTRTDLILLLFDVVTLESAAPPHVVQQACQVLSHLLQEGKHLRGLALPWRPLWRVLLAHHLPVEEAPTFSSRGAERVIRAELAHVAAQCRRHFAPASAAEMLAESAPLLCPHDPARFMLTAALLALLLPTDGAAASAWLPTVMEIWLKRGMDGSPEFDGLWLGLLARLAKAEFYGFADRVQWVPLLPTLYSRCLMLLKLPGGQEARSELRPTYAHPTADLLSAFESHSAAEAVQSAARLLVLTLPPVAPADDAPPEQPGFFGDPAEAAAFRETQMEAAAAEEESAEAAEEAAAGRHLSAGAWRLLRQLLRCLEPYCHPSNAGGYCTEVGVLLQALAQFSWWRVLVESKRKPPTEPRAAALGPRDVWSLCCAMKPLTTTARYSKSGTLGRCAESASKYLLRLSPELFLPTLELGVAEGLQAVTAVHQTASALTTLATLTPVLMRSATEARLPIPLLPAGTAASRAALGALADGPRAMRPLLELMLPGLDANDPRKMMLTLHAIDQLLLVAPLASPEPSTAAGDGQDPFGRLALAEKLRRSGDGEALEALAEQAAGAAELARWLPDFGREVLRRLLGALEHQERVAKGGGSFGQRFMLVQWRSTAALFWAQLSPALFDELLPTLLKLLPRSSLADASKHVGAHLAAAALARPARTLEVALPVFARMLLVGGVGGAGELKPLSEGELTWLVQLLAQTVRCAGEALLPHVALLGRLSEAVAAHAAAKELRKVGKAAYKLQRRLLQGLLSTYPRDLRSLPPSLCSTAAARERPWEGWGWMPLGSGAEGEGEGSAVALEVEWHVPSAAEVAAAEALVDAALRRSEAIAARAAGGEALSETELRSALLELRALAKGALPSVAEAGEADFCSAAREALLPVVGEGEWAEEGVPSLGAGLAGCVSVRPLCGRVALPRSGDARSRVAGALAALGAHLSPSEGSKAQLQMLRVVRVVLSERPSALLGLPSQLVYAARQAWHVRGAGADAHMPRGMLMLQLGARHADRVAASSFGAAVGCAALAPLVALQLQLCTHRYSKVRALAQEGYSLALAAHPWMVRKQVLPLLAMLHASAEPHETKAAAYLLSSSRIAPRVAHDPHLLCALLAALAKSRDHGRPKVTQRVRLAFSLTLGHVTPPLMTLALAPPIREPSDAARAARAALEPYYARVTEGREAARRAAYVELLATAAAGVACPLTEEEGGGGEGEKDKDESTHWSHEVTALSALMVLPARSQPEREAAALVATRALCSPTKAVRNLGRALLFSLLRPPPDAAAGPGGTLASLVAGGAVPGLFDDEAPRGGELWDDVAKGWCGGGGDGGVEPMEVDEVPVATAAPPLGADADALLGSADHLGRVLAWLVTDHKEADDTGATTGGSLAAMAAAAAPHEIICLTMGSGRGWPFTLRHGLHGANFALSAARLLERLAAHYGAALGAPLLPAALPLLAPGAKRDALAVGLEVN